VAFLNFESHTGIEVEDRLTNTAEVDQDKCGVILADRTGVGRQDIEIDNRIVIFGDDVGVSVRIGVSVGISVGIRVRIGISISIRIRVRISIRSSICIRIGISVCIIISL